MFVSVSQHILYICTYIWHNCNCIYVYLSHSQHLCICLCISTWIFTTVSISAINPMHSAIISVTVSQYLQHLTISHCIHAYLYCSLYCISVTVLVSVPVFRLLSPAEIVNYFLMTSHTAWHKQRRSRGREGGSVSEGSSVLCARWHLKLLNRLN